MTRRPLQRGDWLALRRDGKRVRQGVVTITWAPGEPGSPPRVAYAVGRGTGGAVVRNRVRRRLRAVTAELSAELGAGVYLVGAGREAASVPYGQLRQMVREALQRLGDGSPA